MNTKKIIIVGDSGVGKTTFMRRMCGADFDPHVDPTRGYDVRRPRDKTNAHYVFWDSAGTKYDPDPAPEFHKHAALAIVMYDVSKPATDSVSQWKAIIRYENPEIPICVIGNKGDLACEQNGIPGTRSIISLKKDFDPETGFAMLREQIQE